MTQKQLEASVALGIAVGLAVLTQQIAKSYGPAIGIPKAVAPAIVGTAAWALCGSLA